MTKVVINKCFGGFSLSQEAVKRGRELSQPGSPWHKIVLKGETYPDGEVNNFGDSYHIDGDISRTDPILIQVVEELGEKANGSFASLEVVDVPKGTLYRITEYDGNEGIEFRYKADWQEA